MTGRHGRKATVIFAVMALVWATWPSAVMGADNTSPDPDWMAVTMVAADPLAVTFGDALQAYNTDTQSAATGEAVLIAAGDLRVRLHEMQPWPACTIEWATDYDTFLRSIQIMVYDYAADDYDGAITNGTTARDAISHANDIYESTIEDCTAL